MQKAQLFLLVDSVHCEYFEHKPSKASRKLSAALSKHGDWFQGKSLELLCPNVPFCPMQHLSSLFCLKTEAAQMHHTFQKGHVQCATLYSGAELQADHFHSSTSPLAFQRCPTICEESVLLRRLTSTATTKCCVQFCEQLSWTNDLMQSKVEASHRKERTMYQVEISKNE